MISFVQVTVPGGRNRDRKNDLLVVRDNGNSFKIIPPVVIKNNFLCSFVVHFSNLSDSLLFITLQDERDDPTTVIEKEEWTKTRDDMEKHLSKLRDFNVSNWF